MKINKPKFSPSLTTILAISFFSLSVVGLLISGGLQIFSYAQTQQETIIQKQQLIAKDATDTVTSFILEKISILNTVAKITSLPPMTGEVQQMILEGLLGRQQLFRQLILWDSRGVVTARTSRFSRKESEKPINIYLKDLQKQVKEGDTYISPVYINELSSEPMMIVAVPDKNVYGEVQGILATEINLKFMWDFMNGIKVGKTGYAYVIDRRGSLIAFKDAARVLKVEKLNDLKIVDEFIHTEKSGLAEKIFTYKGITGSDVMGTFISLSTPDWAVVTEIPLDEAYGEIIRHAIITLIITLFIAVIAGGLGIFLARQLGIPLVNLTDTATRIAGGEMELEASVSGPKEVATLARMFNKANKFLTEIISTTKEITMNLNSSTKEIEAAVQEQTTASEQNASGVSEVSATLQELTVTARQITTNVGELVYSSEQVISFLKDIEQQLEQIVTQLRDVGEISKNNTTEIAELGKRSILINEMVELIKGVANKTNILSINASIEASRRSESITGFSVIASEIRELSKETIVSAKKAEKAGKEIQELLSSIVVASANESEKVIASAGIVKTIFDNVEEIIGKINNNYSFTQKIDISIKQQEYGSIQAAETMKQMAEIARQTAETSRQISLAARNIVDFSRELEKVAVKYKTKETD